MAPFRQRWQSWFFLFLLAFGEVSSAAEGTNRAARLDYTSFKIVTDRNIFNANRSGRQRGNRDRTSRPSRVDTFALVGTLSYEKGPYAFFEGSDAEYKKVLQPRGTIAGYKVTDITPNGVKLEAAGKQIELRVGTQMRREDAGEWRPAGRSENYAASIGGTASSPTASSGTNESSSGGEVSEVLKRLMQQREQETK